jgi:hypothetical protein
VQSCNQPSCQLCLCCSLSVCRLILCDVKACAFQAHLQRHVDVCLVGVAVHYKLRQNMHGDDVVRHPLHDSTAQHSSACTSQRSLGMLHHQLTVRQLHTHLGTHAHTHTRTHARTHARMHARTHAHTHDTQETAPEGVSRLSQHGAYLVHPLQSVLLAHVLFDAVQQHRALTVWTCRCQA